MSSTSRILRPSAAVLLAVLSAASPVMAQSRAGDRSSIVNADLSHIRIDNFGQVDSTYYRGAQPQGRDYAELAALGIRTVINLAGDDAEANEPAMTEKAGMSYVRIPMTTHDAPTAAQLARFLSIVSAPASQPVYVHCVGGRHRTGVMTAVYRMNRSDWTAEQAFQEMKQYKFGADFLHAEFKQFVYSYARPTPPDRVASAEPAVGATRAEN